MFCTKCGNELNQGAAFCTKCGTRVSGEVVPVEPAPMAEAAAPEEALAPTAEPTAAMEEPALGGASAAGQAPVPNAQPQPQLQPQAQPVPQPQAQFAPHPQAQPQAQPWPQPQAESEPAPAPKKKRTKLVVGIVLAVVIVCAGVGAGVWWKLDQDAKQAAWDYAHTSLVTLVTVDAPGFDEQATAIPVKVVGTDLDGNAVDEVQYLRPGSMQVETLAGNYTLSFPGGYFTGDGTVVKAPDTTLSINPAVDENADTSEPASNVNGSANPDAPIVFAEVDDLEASPEVIEDIAQWAGQDANDNGKAESLSGKATDAHDEAVAAEEKRKAEEEAARKAAEEAARRANPDNVDGLSSTVTLKGRLVREEWTTSKTKMGWSAVAYFLEFDEPVEASFNANGGPTSATLTRVQVHSIEQYDTDADKNLDSITSPEWEQYVGKYIAVKGKLYNTGNAHTLTQAMFQNPTFVEVL